MGSCLSRYRCQLPNMEFYQLSTASATSKKCLHIILQLLLKLTQVGHLLYFNIFEEERCKPLGKKVITRVLGLTYAPMD